MDIKNPPYPPIPPISSSVSWGTTFSLFSYQNAEKWIKMKPEDTLWAHGSLRVHGRAMGGIKVARFLQVHRDSHVTLAMNPYPDRGTQPYGHEQRE